jgi:hypothetical protein
MKVRSGFVSNSSSSSFIVIGKRDDGMMGKNRARLGLGLRNDENVLVVDEDTGEHEFGWEPDTHSFVGDRVIFAYLQTRYAKSDEWRTLLEDVIKEYTGVTEIRWQFSMYDDFDDGDFIHAYIDHQSCATEDMNTEMFYSRDALTQFLFNDDSYIQTNNDNH